MAVNQTLAFVKRMGALPLNFKGGPQALANAIAQRLQISLNREFALIRVGSTLPVRDEGPILLNNTEWWVWDDSIGAYRPLVQPVDVQVQNSFLRHGDFNIWQLGTTFTPANGDYTADGWRVQFDGAGATRTITREDHVMGQIAVPDNPRYFLRWDQSVAGTGGSVNFIGQRIENVDTLSGNIVYVVFYARSSTGSYPVSVLFRQTFGGGGSGTVDTVGPPVTVTSDWQRFAVPINVPSVAGKSRGSNDHIEVAFLFPTDSVFTFDLSHVDLKDGSAEMPFPILQAADEWEIATYYQRTLDGSSAGATTLAFGLGWAFTTTQASFFIDLGNGMRARPTATIQNIANWRVTDFSATLTPDTFGLGAGRSNRRCIELQFTHTAAGFTAFNPQIFFNNDTDDMIILDANL